MEIPRKRRRTERLCYPGRRIDLRVQLIRKLKLKNLTKKYKLLLYKASIADGECKTHKRMVTMVLLTKDARLSYLIHHSMTRLSD